MTNVVSSPRTILQLAAQDAFAPMTTQMLARLGYRFVQVDCGSGDDRDPQAALPTGDLVIVDERRLAEIESDLGTEAVRTPVVLLTGRQGATGADSRIVGAVKKPAGLHDLYQLLQQIFEDTPRSTPRIATQLRARCAIDESAWDSRVLSLSENGCLMRSPEPVLLGQRIQLQLQLPQSEPIAVEAEAAYQLLPDTGFVFHAVDPAQRESLAHFVAQTILSA